MSQNHNYMAVLLDTLEKKKDALGCILKITRKQEELTHPYAYQSDVMERLLDEKDVQIARVNTLDEGFEMTYDRIRTEVKDNPQVYREEIVQLQELIRQCTEIGNAIMVLEERNRNSFGTLFSQSRRDYYVSKTKANVAQHYYRTMSNTKVMDSYFVDKKQ